MGHRQSDNEAMAPGADADTPAGGRRPGELIFSIFLCGASLFLLWEAYGISGFSALSSPGAVPIATSLVMAITAAVVVYQTVRLPSATGERFSSSILPSIVLLFVALLVAYGVLLRPLGFLPTSAVFLLIAIKMLGGRSWIWTLSVALLSLFVIWLIFRLVFSVLMPAGLVPEAEFVQFLRQIMAGAGL